MQMLLNLVFSYLILVDFLLCYRLMIKRAQGRKRLGLKNFKKRYFCLTNQFISYAKSKCKYYKLHMEIKLWIYQLLYIQWLGCTPGAACNIPVLNDQAQMLLFHIKQFNASTFFRQVLCHKNHKVYFQPATQIC